MEVVLLKFVNTQIVLKTLIVLVVRFVLLVLVKLLLQNVPKTLIVLIHFMEVVLMMFVNTQNVT
jgi:hypothetical protein